MNTLEKPHRSAVRFFWWLQVATLSLGRREDPSVMKSLQSVTRQDGGDNFPNIHPAEKQSTKFYILERDELKLLWSALRI